MPKLGQIRRAKEVGYNSGHKVIWAACIGCGKERWVHVLDNKPRNPRCQECNGKLRGFYRGVWAGGKYRDGEGYIKVKIYPEDFFHPMADHNNYVSEHRLVMAKHLGRNLHSWEIVHHKRGVARDDNKIEGLQLVSVDKHNQITIMENKIAKLEATVEEQGKRITLLEAENVLLERGAIQCELSQL